MSADFQPYLIKDPRINNITESVAYGVYSGASQNTYQTFNATSTSTSQISFNVNVPSENTILDREILIGATYDFTLLLNGTTKQNDAVMKYGFTDAFNAFPLNCSISSMNATINNTNISVNTQDVLPILLKMMNPKVLAKYQGTTATYVDSVGFNVAGTYLKPDLTAGTYVSDNFNPLGGITLATHDGVLPRACLPFSSIVVTNSRAGNADQLVVNTDGDTVSARITVDLVEPLFLSPFIFGANSDANSQGFVGLNTLNLNLNIDTSLKRFWSKSRDFLNAGATWTITLNAITNARLMLNFLTSQPTDAIRAKNVIPFTDFPRYITGVANTSAVAKNGGSTTIKSSNIQINQIPDLFLVALRKPMNTQTPFDPTLFLPIKSVSVNFNNASGLLSGATQQQLYNMSSANGVQQSWQEWSGKSSYFTPTIGTTALTTATLDTVMSKLNAGSVLAINPSRDLSLPSYLSNGSLGQFNLQLDVTAVNYSSSDITPELVIICCNSGLLSTISGSSAVYTGLLSKALVLDVAQGAGVSGMTNGRMIGGGMSAGLVGAIGRSPIVSSAVSSSGRGMSRKLDSFVS